MCHFGAQAQDYLQDARYGPDEATRKSVIEKLNMMTDALRINNAASAAEYAIGIIKAAPAASKNAYVVLQNSYRTKIRNAKSVADKNKLVDSLMYYYDVRAKAFEEDVADIYSRRAQDYRKYRQADTKKVIEYFKEAIDKGGKDVDPNFVTLTFAVLIEGYQFDAVTTEELLNEYDKLMVLVEDESTPEKTEAKKSIEQLMITSGAANCENLEKLFKPKYTATPDDLDLLKKITTYLTREKCNTPFRLLVTEHYYNLSPTPENAILLAGMYEDKGDATKAIAYLRKAIADEKNVERKSGFIIRAAASAVTTRNYKDAAEFSKSAITLNPNNGLAYMILAQAYGQGCETACSAFDRQTVYWIVVDYLTKARTYLANDAKQVSNIDSQLAVYRSNFPNSEECFFRSLEEGAEYNVNCGWINGKTTVRIRK